MNRREILDKLNSAPLKSGLRNCHHVGLHSVVMEERPNGSLSRIFFTTDESTMDRPFRPDGHLTVGAHNHDKGVRFTLLAGRAWHLWVDTDRIDAISPVWFRYPFNSAIDSGKFGIGEQRRLHVSVTVGNLDNTYMSTSQTHTVLATPRTAWHCDEGPKEPKQKYIWSPRGDLELDATGLYQPMSAAELEESRELLLGWAL